MRVLILRGGALGDFLVTWPAIRALRLRWPRAEIELVGNRRAAELAVRARDLDRVHSQDDARFLPFFSEAPLPVELAAWLSSFDRVYNFWPDPDGLADRHLAAHVRQLISRGAKIETTPAARHFLSAMEEMPAADTTEAAPDPAQFSFVPDEKSFADADRRLEGMRDFIALHPGSGSPRKNWPVKKWQMLIGRLAEPILMATGEAEQESQEWMQSAPILRAHQWPLPALAAALAQCRLFIGHDSGVSHLAAAVGAPCLLLFGPTDPKIWAPPGKRVHVIRKAEQVDSIEVDEVLEACGVNRRQIGTG